MTFIIVMALLLLFFVSFMAALICEHCAMMTRFPHRKPKFQKAHDVLAWASVIFTVAFAASFFWLIATLA